MLITVRQTLYTLITGSINRTPVNKISRGSVFKECYSSKSTDSMDELKNIKNVVDKQENGDPDSEKDEERKKKIDDFLSSKLRVRKRPLSPSARLQSILPEGFTKHVSDDHDHKFDRTVKIPIQTNSVALEKTSQSKSKECIEKPQELSKVKSKGNVLPSRRISNLIPKEYWESLDNGEAKQIVDGLGEKPTEDDSEKNKT